ncbi:hypothetical protein TNCV_3461261 [Trichonephila clavipes]|nr:hypothetical protein TNCV_3461261 [Trichonephila clavipes]
MTEFIGASFIPLEVGHVDSGENVSPTEGIPQHLKPSSRKSCREVDGKGREVGGPDHTQGVLPQNWGGTEQSRTVTCMVLKAKANDRRKNLALRWNEYRGP